MDGAQEFGCCVNGECVARGGLSAIAFTDPNFRARCSGKILVQTDRELAGKSEGEQGSAADWERFAP
jgi:hypothetical protein